MFGTQVQFVDTRSPPAFFCSQTPGRPFNFRLQSPVHPAIAMVQDSKLNLAEALLPDISDPTFLPCPQITLCVDSRASLGLCGICQTAQLKLQNELEHQSTLSRAITIIPCGHLACYGCLMRCLENKAECPFCRFPLHYELCHHPLKGRVITEQSLFSIPDTIPMGGRIPDQCPDCRVATNRRANESILKSLVDGFRILREQYRTADDRSRVSINHRLHTMQKQFHLVTRKLSNECTEELTAQW